MGKPKKEAKPKEPEAPQDRLDLLEQAQDPLEIIALMLWKDRHRNPDLCVHITRDDVAEFEKCTAFLQITAGVKIERPRGAPARAALPPSRVHPQGLPAQPAETPREFVFVGVGYVEKGIFNSIKPIESTEDGAERRDSFNRLRHIRERGPQLAQQLLSHAAAGTFSSAMVEEAAHMLNDVAKLTPS